MHEPEPRPPAADAFSSNELSLLAVEVSVANEGDLRWVSEDRVPHGEALCQPAGLSHQLFPLFLLQQQAQVNRLCSFPLQQLGKMLFGLS